jgi:hypothetical protein
VRAWADSPSFSDAPTHQQLNKVPALQQNRAAALARPRLAP